MSVRLFCCLLLALSSAHAANFNVARFGARGDAHTLDTAAIQRTIDAAARAGGTVVFQPGTYLTGSIFVKSGVTLKIGRGVTLLGSQHIADYPVLPTRIAGIEMDWPAALVNIVGQHHASITGEGTIDGDGKVFWDSYWALRKEYEPKGLRWASDYDARRPRLVQVFDSTNVTIGGTGKQPLLLRRAGFWTVHVCYSTGVTIDGVTIRNNEDGHGPSTDGIDIDSSRRVLVQHADIDVNDDALVLKAGRDADGLRVGRPTEDVVIRDSLVRAGAAGITFGSETSGGFRNVEAYRIKVLGKVPVGILFKSARARGGFGTHLNLHDFELDDVATVLQVTMNWNPSYSYAAIPAGSANVPAYWTVLATPVPAQQGRAQFHHVRIANIHARGAKTAFKVDAYPDAPLRDFRFTKLAIDAADGGTINDAIGWRFTDSVFNFGKPVIVGRASDVAGLPAGTFQLQESE